MAPRKEITLSLHSFLLLALFAVGLGAFYRLPGLERRAMHTDEAILAVKAGEFWETGRFEYDPHDYHGPALHQVTWLWGHVAGWEGPQTWTPAQVRMVAVACGLVLLLMTFLMGDALGRFGTGWAMLLSAASPMMVYYSRYYIMEMLLVVLVALSLASFWRYSQGGGKWWLLLGGAALGFQHATKETFVLNVAAAICGWLAARMLVGEFTPRPTNSFSFGSTKARGRVRRSWLWVVIPAVLVSIAAFSDGFRDWRSVLDSVTTYGNYLHRSGGSGHEKPFTYYLVLIFGQRDKVYWSEALIGGLGILGMFHAFFGTHKHAPRQAFLVFLSVYTVALFGVYSLLSYKTPWSILSAQHSLTLLAGVGAGAVWMWFRGRIARWIFIGLLIVGVYNLCDQTSRITGNHPHASLELSADASNPYAYSHTLPKVLKLVAEVERIAAGRGNAFNAQVINRDQGWPLPWYWRNLPRIGYQSELPENLNAPVVIVDAEWSEAAEAKMSGKGYDRGTQFGLRPGVIVVMYVKDKPAATPDSPAPATPLPPVNLPEPPATLLAPPARLSPVLPPLPAVPLPALPTAPP